MLSRSVYFVMALALATGSAGAAGAAPRLTQDRAIAIASAFCQRIGAPAAAEATAVYPAPTRVPADQPAIHWQPRWKVAFGAQAEVEVVDATGIVAWYSNHALYQGPHPPDAPAGPGMPRQAAIQRATVVLRASGQRDELGPVWAREEQTHGPPTERGHGWYVRWPRQYKGITYQHQSVNVLLRAETGVVTGLCVSFPSAPPTTAALNVSRDKAIATARGQLAQASVPVGELVKAEREVVQPNDRWQPGSRETRLAGTARVVWVCRFSLGDSLRDVWVDSATGAVVGGQFSGRRLAVRAAGAESSLRKALGSAQAVRVYTRGRRGGGWSKEPLLVLDRHTNAAVFRTLLQSRRFQPTGVLSRAWVKLVFDDGKETQREFVYYPDIGQLGMHRDEFCLVPTAFKDWMNKQMPPEQKPAPG